MQFLLSCTWCFIALHSISFHCGAQRYNPYFALHNMPSTVHYITLLCMALPRTAFYSASPCAALLCIALPYAASYMVLRCITLLCIALIHRIGLHFTAAHSITLQYIALRYVALHYIALQEYLVKGLGAAHSTQPSFERHVHFCCGIRT